MVAPTMIKEHMEVLGSDGVHVGTVDGLEGRDQVKLTTDDAVVGGPRGRISRSRALGEADKVRRYGEFRASAEALRPGAEAKARWKTH